jgi:sialidase-1
MRDLTLSTWVRTTNSSRYETIASTYEPSGSEYSYLVRTTPAGTVGVLIGGANIGSGDRFAAADTRPINDGAWHHIAVVFRLGQGVSFYIDGALSSKATVSIQAAARGATLQFGVTGWLDYGNYFAGDLDQMRMYSRALTDGEIAALAGE